VPHVGQLVETNGSIHLSSLLRFLSRFKFFDDPRRKPLLQFGNIHDIGVSACRSPRRRRLVFGRFRTQHHANDVCLSGRRINDNHQANGLIAFDIDHHGVNIRKQVREAETPSGIAIGVAHNHAMGFEGNPEPFAREGAVLQANLSCDVALLLLSEGGLR